MKRVFCSILMLAVVCLSPVNAADMRLTVDSGVLVLPGKIEFIADSDSIKNQSSGIIDMIALFMKDNPDVKILRIEGYCSSMGDENSNMELSRLRAMSVAKAVIARGVPCRRLFASGFGSGLPFSSAGKSGDRIAAVIAAGKFKKPGIMPLDGGGITAGETCK